MITLEDVKLHQNITWDTTPDEEARLENDLRRAKAYITDFAGYPLREDDEVAEQLVLDCALYIKNQVLPEFQKNYSEDLILLREKYRVNNAEEFIEI